MFFITLLNPLNKNKKSPPSHFSIKNGPSGLYGLNRHDEQFFSNSEFRISNFFYCPTVQRIKFVTARGLPTSFARLLTTSLIV
jgi:hypothetical protein